MNARHFGLSTPAENTYLFRKARTSIAAALMRFSCAYADLALWVAPWLAEEEERFDQ
jgi:hypothetical protein